MKLKMGKSKEKGKNAQNAERAYSWPSMQTEEAAEDAAILNSRNKLGKSH